MLNIVILQQAQGFHMLPTLVTPILAFVPSETELKFTINMQGSRMS